MITPFKSSLDLATPSTENRGQTTTVVVFYARCQEERRTKAAMYLGRAAAAIEENRHKQLLQGRERVAEEGQRVVRYSYFPLAHFFALGCGRPRGGPGVVWGFYCLVEIRGPAIYISCDIKRRYVDMLVPHTQCKAQQKKLHSKDRQSQAILLEIRPTHEGMSHAWRMIWNVTFAFTLLCRFTWVRYAKNNGSRCPPPY